MQGQRRIGERGKRRMGERINSHRELHVYRNVINAAMKIFELTKLFPSEEKRPVHLRDPQRKLPGIRDAEQVGAGSFTAGAGSIQIGSIDEPGIQKAIVSIMEGGQEAFARRKEIYQLWKQ